MQAIADEVDQKLSATGVEPKHLEGYNQADWVLMDYVDFVVHIFSESARKFYDLERLWKIGQRGCNSPTWRSLCANPQRRRPLPVRSAPSRKTTAKSAAKSAPRKRSSSHAPRKSS